MEVDEQYNPGGDLTERGARRQYMLQLRARDAEEMRLKYLGANQKQAANAINQYHNESRTFQKLHSKPFRQGRVTYVFEDQKEEAVNQDKEEGLQRNQQEQDESIRDILQQKERIRSIITPGNDAQKAENKALDPGAGQNAVEAEDGRSPYQGAQLQVVSINQKDPGAGHAVIKKNDEDSNVSVPDKAVSGE